MARSSFGATQNNFRNTGTKRDAIASNGQNGWNTASQKGRKATPDTPLPKRQPFSRVHAPGEGGNKE